jgi:nucleoside-diphosphate-sugar epimerase
VRIAFVGGTRFIGHTAARASVERGHDVCLLHRGRHRNEVAGARSVHVDRADPQSLCAALAREKPEVVIDTRAMTRPEAEVSALALKILRCPAVVLSSQDVYAQFGRLNGLPAPEPETLVGEDAPLTVPFPFRGLAEHEGGEDYDKKEVERVFVEALGDGVPGVSILRLPAVYGPRDEKRRFGQVVDALDRGERVLPCQDGASIRWSHAHVRDAAHAIVLAAEQVKDGPRVYNVGEQDPPTMRERAAAIAKSMGVSIAWEEREELPAKFGSYGRLPNDFVVDTARIRAELGYAEVTSQAGRVDSLVEWLRASRRA